MTNVAPNAAPVDTRVQTVIFLRHGVARHNLPDRHTGQPLNHHDPSLLDPALVYEGKLAAITAGYDIRTWLTPSRKVELIVTSPLTRCLQTTALAFLPGEEDDYFNYTTTPTGSQQQQASQSVPIVAKHDAREAFGIYYPDKRRPMSQLEAHWPQVRFEDGSSEEDTAWSHERRETWADIEARVNNFLRWLVHRHESVIAVVTHGVWLETLFRLHDPAVVANGQRVHNCDAFACQVHSRDWEFVCLQQTQQISKRSGR